MRIVLVTTGSLGDVQPFVALAGGLGRAGHSVRLAGPCDASELAEERGIEFYPIDGGQRERLAAQPSVRVLEGGNTLRFGVQRIQKKRRIFHEVNLAAWKACQGAEAIIYRIGGYLAADSMAEKLDRPCIKAGLVPYTPTGDFPNLRVFRGRDLGRLGNRLSYIVAEQAVWQFFRPEINEFRRKNLGLAPYPLSGPERGSFTGCLPLLYGFSPALLPPPGDWPANVSVTGQWELEDGGGWQPPDDLVDFVEAGAPPVYVGFGSMVSQDPGKTYDLICRAVRRCGQRAVLASGWGGLGGETERSQQIFTLGYASHRWLFPRMAAVVHHGGIGTTTNGLKAGVPNIIVPFNYDQPFWGVMVFRRGVGPKPIPRKELSEGALAEAIEKALNDGEMRRKAAEIGRRIRQEDGVGVAVRLIQHNIS